MTGFFLDLRNRDETLGFIADAMEYLPPTPKKRAAQELEKIEARGALTVEELATLAKEVGRKSWAERSALKHYLATQAGCDLEWRKVVAAVSDSTAHILERFRHGTACTSLDEVLNHEESASAFRDLERFEIAEVRRHARHGIWGEKRRDLAKETGVAETRLAEIIQRLDALRQLAGDAPWVQDEILSKLDRLEDRLYFKGEELDTALLDEEIKYYREEKELPAEER